MTDIERGRALLAAGTQGEWEVRGCVVAEEAVDVCFVEGTTHHRVPVCTTEAQHGFDAKANAALIAFEHNILPALLDVAEAARSVTESDCDRQQCHGYNEGKCDEECDILRLRAALDRLGDR